MDKDAQTKLKIEIGKRVASARDAVNLSQTELAERVGVVPQHIGKMEKGHHFPSVEVVRSIAIATGASVDWLLARNIYEVDTGRGAPKEGWKVPLKRVQRTDNVLTIDDKQHVTASFPCSPRSFAVEIWDTSNTALYQIGDRVVIDPERSQTPGRMVLVRTDLGETVFGKLQFETSAAGKVTIITPINSDFPALRSDLQTFEILGVESEHTRRSQ